MKFLADEVKRLGAKTVRRYLREGRVEAFAQTARGKLPIKASDAIECLDTGVLSDVKWDVGIPGFLLDAPICIKPRPRKPGSGRTGYADLKLFLSKICPRSADEARECMFEYCRKHRIARPSKATAWRILSPYCTK